jgi:deazaflavin-dependent oxidoreductase (nitroreductase family)
MDIPYETEERLREVFKALNKFMVLLFRLGLGRWGNGNRLAGYIMVIGHRGRNSGMKRLTPVNFTRIVDEIYCTAAFGQRSDWYRNVMADPNVELWLPKSRMRGIATDVTESERAPELLRSVLIASGFAAPMFGIWPSKLSETDLKQLLLSYRLIRIDQLEPITGPAGPGELAWVWPLATFLLLGLLLGRGRRTARRRRRGAGQPA